MAVMKIHPKQKEWSYDVMTDCYKHISGVSVDRVSIDRHGGDLETALDTALMMHQNSQQMGTVGAIGAPSITGPSIGYPGMPYPYSSHGPIPSINNSPNSFTISNPPNPNNIVITTDKGTITLNLKTGDITFPLEIGRDEAIRDFWMGFQLYFGVDQDSKFQTRIKELENECFKLKNEAASKVKQKIIDKISKKYGSEKFIMTKPAELLKLIEGD